MKWSQSMALVFLAGCSQPEPGICGRGYQDAVSLALCTTPRPIITDLVSLQRAVGLDPDLDGPTTAALNANSASLVARLVSPLNPRLVMLKRDVLTRGRDPGLVVLTFTRGEPFVELVARDRSSGELRFFLVRFEKTCTASGCNLAEQFTEEIEKDWTAVSVLADDELTNTPMDCLRCHQPAGPGTEKILRMQELKFPWTHWMAHQATSPQGQQLLADFTATHAPAERYGGVPVATLADAIAPAALETLIEDEGYADQPNEFDSIAIAAELGPAETQDSATWNGLYLAATTAQAIPVPFSKLRPTDAQRQTIAGRAYLDFAAGRIPASQLVDFRTLLSLEAERAMSIRPREGASGREILVQLCQGCHNSRLDQTISRAKFDVEKLDQLSRGEKSLAIARLRFAPEDPRLMPPRSEAYLSADELAAVIAELEK